MNTLIHFTRSFNNSFQSITLFISIFFYCGSAEAQKMDSIVNAYVLSHDLYVFEKKIKSHQPADTSLKREANILLSKLYFYSNANTPQELDLFFKDSYLIHDLIPRIQDSAGYTSNSQKLNYDTNRDFTKHLAAIQEKNYETNIIATTSTGSLSGWKIPSEAEMIDAVATYIASRVKQETVLWFFEEMRINTERYDLITTAFPETIKLLKSNEVFEAPNMGSAWKYALSKDFVKLPEHVLNSDWLDKRIPENRKEDIELLKVATEISLMVNNRMSYRDIIRQLYLKYGIVDHTSDLRILHNSISFLYAVSNELSVENSEGKLRNITFEELQAMSVEQFLLMLQLLDAKYDKTFQELSETSPERPFDKNKKQQLSIWIGKSLQALSQIDQILEQINESNKKESKQAIVFDGYNAWKLMSNVMVSTFPNPNESKYRFILSRMDDAFEVYNLLEQKNYAGAVVKTMQLVDSLVFVNNLTLSKAAYQKNSQFVVPVIVGGGGKYGIDLTELDELFAQKHVNPKKFPRIAKRVKKGMIYFTNNNGEYKIKGNSLKISADSLCALMIDSLKSNHFAIKQLFKKLNRSVLDSIVRNPEVWGGTVTGDSINFPVNSLAGQALVSQDKKAMQMAMKFASFLNDVALADNEKELKKVVESYALPPGSYKQKRNAWQSLTFNAFAGAYTGYETSSSFLFRNRIDTINQFGWNYGISVPIGLTYSKTFGKRTYANSRLSKNYRYNPDLIKIGKNQLYVRSNWNVSVTLSIVDIGAVVSYRLSNKDSVLNQSFRWEQFVSPGLHIGLAIPRTPLVFQFGYQYTPQIRRIKDGSDNTPQYGMWRTYAGIFFDIPIFNLWMKTRSVYFE